MKKLALFAMLVCLFMMLSMCKHEPFEVVDKNNPSDTTSTDTTGTTQNPPSQNKPCDPDTVYFENDILPIFISNCTMAGCHDANTASDGVVLTSYASVMQSDIIRTGNPEQSDLYEAITENDQDDIMPRPPANPLSSDQIALIRKWIAQGAQNKTCDASGPCDTTNVSFSASILPLIETNCQGCHSGSAPSGSVSLTSHSEIKTVADDGRLYGVTARLQGYEPMPQGGNKLPDCDIAKIKAWIEEGTLNN